MSPMHSVALAFWEGYLYAQLICLALVPQINPFDPSLLGALHCGKKYCEIDAEYQPIFMLCE